MTALSVVQDACTSGIALQKPTEVFGSSDRDLIELGALLQEVAEMIALSHDKWQKLVTLHSQAGDGSTTAFDLPSDFRRMLLDTQVWSTSTDEPLVRIASLNEWLAMDIRDQDFITNAWIIYGDQMHFNPALGSAETVKWWYQSDLIVTAADTTTKTAFTADTDTFRLDERLLKLGLIYKWREMKGLPYAENMADYERVLSKLITAEGGPEVITLGPGVSFPDARLAYPMAAIEG